MQLISKEYIQNLLKNKDRIIATMQYHKFLVTFKRTEYSDFNKLLVYSQNSKATDVRWFGMWLKAGRAVKKGERAIKICVAWKFEKEKENWETLELKYFKYSSVFDISQTEEKK